MSDTCKKKYTYFITGGGTGGHIYPAIAVAEALRKDETTKDIYYIGNPKNMEYDIVKKAHFKFLPVKVSGMPRKFGFALIKWAVELELANWKALYYLFRFKPNAVLGTGGYVSAPALFASNIYKTPYMIHDCDAQPGIVSKFTAPMAKRVSLAFEDSKHYIHSDNISINGNPIRERFKTLTKQEARQNLMLDENKITICIMGGSQGAKSINNAALNMLKKLFENFDVQVIFQTGAKHYKKTLEDLLKVYPDFDKNKNLVVKPYFDDMVTILKASDIAVSRAGSLSISEMCACSIAPILIPYPYAASNHQRKNAKSLLNQGACLYLEDDETTCDTIFEKISELLNDEEKLLNIQNNSGKLAKPDATLQIVEQLKRVASGE